MARAGIVFLGSPEVPIELARTIEARGFALERAEVDHVLATDGASLVFAPAAEPHRETFTRLGRAHPRSLLVAVARGEYEIEPWLEAGAHDVIDLASPDLDRRVEVLLKRRLTRNRTFDDLALSEARYRSLVDHAPDAILVLDVETLRLVDANVAAERLFGRTRAELCAMRAIELSPPTQFDGTPSAEIGAPLLRRARAGESVVFEWSLRHKNGSDVRCEVSMVPLPGGRLLRGSIVDIGERKRMEARLVLSARMATVGMLASGVAHEINNPLAALASNVAFVGESIDALPHEHPARADLVSALDDAREATNRIRDIVRDLQSFSRHEAERLGPVDVRRVVLSTVALVDHEIRHRARLVIDVPDVPHVLATESRFGHVVLDLLLQASRSLAEGFARDHEVRVSARPDGADKVVLEISDTGPPLPAGSEARVFEPFFSSTPFGRGGALGLAVVHGIVTQLGGEITARNNPRAGVAFRVTLPVAPPTQQPPKPVEVAAKRRARVLVVDDEPLVARAVTRLIGQHHEVLVRQRAVEALELLRAGERFDAILCDMLMPEMGGIDLFEVLRRDHPEMTSRIVFMTGGSFTQRALDFLDAAACKKIEKPFQAAELLGVLAELIEG